MSLLDNLLKRFHNSQLLPGGRHTRPVQMYTIEILQEIERFVQHHMQVSNPLRAEADVQEYVASLVEQMVAHFEYQQTAVQAFVGHYAQLITEGTSPQYIYHPLRFLRVMSEQEYRQYVYWLYGFAEDIYRLFVSHKLFNEYGRLIASYQDLRFGVLYLTIRPEVPDVFM